MAGDRVDAARRGWATRKASGWQSEDVRRERLFLEDLRRDAAAVIVQAHYGEDLLRIAESVRTICLTAGTSVHTAYLVAGTFVEGLQREWGARHDK